MQVPLSTPYELHGAVDEHSRGCRLNSPSITIEEVLRCTRAPRGKTLPRTIDEHGDGANTMSSSKR